MDKLFAGICIRMERQKKGWSQAGLCKGICAVSYLSKIEQGKADAAPEVIQLLLARLGLSLYDGGDACKAAADVCDRLYEAVFSADHAAQKAVGRELLDGFETFVRTPSMLDVLLLRAYLNDDAPPNELSEYATCFDERRQVLWLVLHRRSDELLKLFPSAFSHLLIGFGAYENGNYLMALEHLQHSYTLAAAQGYAHMMLQSRLLMGNCYSNTLELNRMLEHYRVAERLAIVLNDGSALADIRYNTASTRLELGDVLQSYETFSRMEQYSAMALHKLAICCEKLGKIDEAFSALCRAEEMPCGHPPEDLKLAMCALVRYRLEHPDYLNDPYYGSLLTSTFRRLRKELPAGYAGFHLPWMLEWHTAARQYKQAYELMHDFPAYGISSAF